MLYMFFVGRHPTLERVRRAARLRHTKRLLAWAGYHSSISWAEFQLCCLPRSIGPCANIHSINCGSSSRLHRYLRPRIDPCECFPSAMAHGPFAPICYSGSPRDQRSCGWISFYSGVSALGNWLSDVGTRRWDKFGHGAMVGCYCRLDICECGMVRSGNLDWDHRWWCTGPMLVRRSEATVVEGQYECCSLCTFLSPFLRRSPIKTQPQSQAVTPLNLAINRPCHIVMQVWWMLLKSPCMYMYVI